MKHILFFSLPLLLLVLSCSDNEPTESNSIGDAFLNAKIIGTWTRGDYQTITFDPNGNFEEILDYKYVDTTIENAEIKRGTYDILNGVLSYTSITEWSINLPNNYKSTFEPLENNEGYVERIIPVFKIQFEGDLMYWRPLDILVSEDNNTNELWGNWKCYQWALEKEYFTNNRTVRKLIWEYNFNKPRMEAIIGAKFLGDSSFTYANYSYELFYDPPEIRWGGNFIRTAEFHNNQLWITSAYNNNPDPYRREK